MNDDMPAVLRILQAAHDRGLGESCSYSEAYELRGGILQLRARLDWSDGSGARNVLHYDHSIALGTIELAVSPVGLTDVAYGAGRASIIEAVTSGKLGQT